MEGIQELKLMLPEIVLLGMICIVLLADIFVRDPQHRLAYWLSQVSLIVTGAAVLFTLPQDSITGFYGLYISDPMSGVLKAFICLLSVFALVYSREYLVKHQLLKGEYYVLALFAVMGTLVMASAHSLLTVYLGLELLSLSLYSMVAIHRGSPMASEAAMKYFVLGALASGILLYGMSLLYGLTGTLVLAEISAAVQTDGLNVLQAFALVFVLVGIAFKLGAVPFHMWLPDVYHGAPTSVTLFISSPPKLAAFAMAMRLLVDGMEPLLLDWQMILIVMAVLSMAVGNVIAIAQTNIKRMLAYSTIAHVGFLLFGILAGTPGGYAGAMFYVISYAIMGMGAFAVVILLGRQGAEADLLDDYRGLAERSPWLALLMLIVMFSMAGIPPFLGFWAKWFVLREVIAAGFIWLAVIGVIFAIIGAFYYLRVVKLMYFDEPADTTIPEGSMPMRVMLSINGISLLVLGLSPGILISLCIAAF